MDFMTIKQASEKWGISEEMHPLRHVQKCFWSLALIFFNKGL